MSGNMGGAECDGLKEIPINLRFMFPHVDNRRANLFVGNRLQQGICIHDFAACGIDEDGRWLQPFKSLLIEQVIRWIGSVGSQWGMQRDDITAEGFF